MFGPIVLVLISTIVFCQTGNSMLVTAFLLTFLIVSSSSRLSEKKAPSSEFTSARNATATLFSQSSPSNSDSETHQDSSSHVETPPGETEEEDASPTEKKAVKRHGKSLTMTPEQRNIILESMARELQDSRRRS